MSDSGSGGSQFVAETAQAVKEVVGDVKDAVGEFIESGVQSATGMGPTPQQIQQKQQQDQAELVKVRKHINMLKGLDAKQKQVRVENTQKEQQRIASQQSQPEVQSTQAGLNTAPISQTKPTDLPSEVMNTRSESKMGRGIQG